MKPRKLSHLFSSKKITGKPAGTDGAPAQEKKPEIREKRRAVSREVRKRLVPAVVLGVIFTLIAALVIFGVHTGLFFLRFDDEMFNSLSALQNQLDFSERLSDTFTEIERANYQAYARLAAAALDRAGFGEETLSQLPEAAGAKGAECYVCRGSRVLFSGNGDHSLPVDRSRLETLRSEGILTEAEAIYSYAECTDNDAFVLVRWPSDTDAESGESIAFITEGNTLVIRTANGSIYSAPEESWIGTTCRIRSLDSMPELKSLFDSIQLPEGTNLGFAMIGGVNCVVGFRSLSPELTGVYYCPVKEVINSSFGEVFVPLALLLLTMAGLLLHAATLCRSRLLAEAGADVRHLHGQWYLDKTALSHIAALTVFCMLLFALPSLYTRVLTGYSTQNVTANEALSHMTDLLDEDTAIEDIIRQNYYSISTGSSSALSWLIAKDPTLVSDEGAAVLRDIAGAISLTIYDGSGISVASTTGFTGYPLAEDPADPSHAFRELLLGDTNSITVESDDYAVMRFGYRRMDAPGLLILEMDSSPVQALHRTTSPASALLSTDFGSSARGYIDAAGPTVLHWAPNNSATIQEINVTLSDTILADGFSGVTKILGMSYYLNVRHFGETIFLTALPLTTLYMGANIDIFIGIVCYVVMFFLLALCTVFLRRKSPQPASAPEKSTAGDLPHRSYAALVMDNSFRKITRHLFTAAVLLLVALLLSDLYLADMPLLKFLFATGSNWQKGLNIFSVTTILLVDVLLQLVCFVVYRLILFFSDNLGAQGVTIGHMLSGLVKVGGVLGAFLYTAVQLGFNPSALLASLGVTGVVFGLGAQQTVNDLLSGLFIIFEGNFHVGDWVEIDGWRGQVMDIGVRTTKVNRSGCVKIFNNSSIKGVITFRRTEPTALVNLSVDYAEDVDRVITLVQNHTAEYRSENPHITEGPKVLGVSNLADSGVELLLWAIVDDPNHVGATERDLRRITKRIFDANGVSIPFPQVVVHDGGTGRES